MQELLYCFINIICHPKPLECKLQDARELCGTQERDLGEGIDLGVISREGIFQILGLDLPSCCCSVAKSYPTPCNPMDCSTPDFPILHYLLEFAQTCRLSR